jgi:hypothetical protein
MRNWKSTSCLPRSALLLMSIAALSLPLTGCGGSAADGTGTTGTGGATASDTPTPTVSASPTPSTFDPAETFSFSINGPGGTTPSQAVGPVNTDNMLQVQVTPGSAGPLSIPGSYSGFSANYNCVQFNVTVLGQTLSTGLISLNGQCINNVGGAYQYVTTPTSVVLDFSSRVSGPHGPVTVTISNAQYDFYCALYMEYYQYYGPYSPQNPFAGSTPGLYCPVKTVYSNHTVTGSIAVQVNGTSLN